VTEQLILNTVIDGLFQLYVPAAGWLAPVTCRAISESRNIIANNRQSKTETTGFIISMAPSRPCVDAANFKAGTQVM
jgi:hypothetical protein